LLPARFSELASRCGRREIFPLVMCTVTLGFPRVSRGGVCVMVRIVCLGGDLTRALRLGALAAVALLAAAGVYTVGVGPLRHAACHARASTAAMGRHHNLGRREHVLACDTRSLRAAAPGKPRHGAPDLKLDGGSHRVRGQPAAWLSQRSGVTLIAL